MAQPNHLPPAAPVEPLIQPPLATRAGRYLPPDLAGDMARGDDAGRLIEAFVHLACARAAIASYLPRTLLDQLTHGAESPALHWLDGSLLFADLSGSTALAERLSTLGREGTEMVTACLNQIFARLIQVIHDYGGDLVAFGGDALLVFFGGDRHPRAASRAALALQAAMHGYVQEVPGIGSFPMHLHVGVESGRVAFLRAGGTEHLHYSVLGATVNRVAAAEGYAQPNEVVVGPGTWADIAELARADEIAPGFRRIHALRSPARPHMPLPENPPIVAPPAEAIPPLLDDLDRISRFIPPVLLGRILAEPQRPQIEAELRPVTVLFAQVVGLEDLAEALPPVEAARAVQVYVGAMHAAVERFGGMVNKLDVADEGVKLVAIFGAPAAYEDHPQRAARAALEMQARLAEVNTQIGQLDSTTDHRPPSSGRPSSLVELRQRIGLNLGTAFAGNVGSDVRKEYTVMGDAVNVAARVMSKATWGQVWCSEAAAQAIGAQIQCEDRGALALKGKALPVQLFELAGLRDQPAGGEAVGDDTPLIGREADLDWLRAHLDATLAGQGRAVRIVGEAGVGKSRLTAALLAEATARGVRIIQAACFSYTSEIPYAAWGEWLKALCDIRSGDDDELRTTKISRALAALGPGMDEWLPLLGDLARLDVPDNRLTRGLNPQMRQARRFELLEQLLLSSARTGPVLTLFEDLHWCDSVSLDLWRRMAGALGDHPVLLLGAHRPAPLFDADPDGARELALKELSRDQSGDLVAALAGGRALPPALVQQLVERAEGNPLFLSELLRAVLDKLQAAGLAAQPGELPPGALHRVQAAIADLPDSLNGLLLARIDRLDEASRSVLRLASVIGQRIPFGVLQSIQNFDQTSLLRDLTRLDAADLTALERLEPERVHIFRHALIQEVAYQSMLYARRRELHGRIGEYLERRYSSDLDDYYGLLAHHYRLSDRRDKAIDYLLLAGQSAGAVFANDEAIQSFVWALDALAGDDADPRAWAVRDALGDVFATIGRYDDALAQHATILAAPGLGANAAWRAHRKSGNVLERQGQYSAALDALAQAIAIVQSDAPDISPLALSIVNADIGLVRWRRGEFDLAIAACEAGLRAVQDDPNSFDDEKTEARLHSTLGAINASRGDYARARPHFERSLSLHTLVDDLPGMVVSHNNLGYLWQLQSEYERAIEQYRVAEEIAQRINLRYALIFANLNMAWALVSLSRYTEAETRSRTAMALAQEINDQRNYAQCCDILGLIAARQGEYSAALARYDEELELHRALGSAPEEGSTLVNKANVLLMNEDFAGAQALLQLAQETAERLNAQRLKVEVLNALAEAALGTGDLARATQHAEEAMRLSTAIGSRHETGVAYRLLGRVQAGRGKNFEQHFRSSVEVFEQTNDQFELGRSWAAYGAALLKYGNVSLGETYLKRAKDTFISIGANGELERLRSIAERNR